MTHQPDDLERFLGSSSIPLLSVWFMFGALFAFSVTLLNKEVNRSRLIPHLSSLFLAWLVTTGAIIISWNSWDQLQHGFAYAALILSFFGVVRVIRIYRRQRNEGVHLRAELENPDEYRYISHLAFWVFKKLLNDDQRRGLSPIKDNRILDDPGVGTSGLGAGFWIATPFVLVGIAWLVNRPLSVYQVFVLYGAQLVAVLFFALVVMTIMKTFAYGRQKQLRIVEIAFTGLWVVVISLAPGSAFEWWWVVLALNILQGGLWGLANGVRLRWLKSTRSRVGPGEESGKTH